jgi:undecaprenyl-diphosphatase
MDLLQIQIVDLLNPDNPSALDGVVLFFTWLGEWKFLALVGIGAFFVERELGKALLVALILTAVVVYPLKILIHEERPWFEHSEIRAIGDTTPSGSFPSGHAAFSFAYFMVLSDKNRRYTGILLTTAFLVSLTRLYLGQHYPIDVAVGAFIGVIGGSFATRFFLVKDTGG